MSHVGCPGCGLTLSVRGGVAPQYCPRCIARFGRLVQLEPAEPPEARTPRSPVRSAAMRGARTADA